MTRHFSIHWYNEEPAVARAFLYNLRDRDLRTSGRINRGEIVLGACGLHVAEKDVDGFSGTIVDYLPNRCCEWQGHFLTCMALKDLPIGPVPRGQSGGLRHRHCVVAELTSPASVGKAKALGLPIINSVGGRTLVNLEVASFGDKGRQAAYRRATLL